MNIKTTIPQEIVWTAARCKACNDQAAAMLDALLKIARMPSGAGMAADLAKIEQIAVRALSPILNA